MANQFEAEIQASCKLLGIYYHKLAVSRGTRWKRDSPFDGYTLRRGVYTALEMKSQKPHAAFSLKRLTENQERELLRVIDEGCRAFLLVNMRTPEIRAWAIPMLRWRTLKDELAKQHRKSIPRELFDDRDVAIPIPRVKDEVEKIYYWDLRVILEG
jgi:penicillin-binding protein-related factor A (putative recombinase)